MSDKDMDIAEILGPEGNRPPPVRKMPRKMDAQDFFKPVTVSFLAQVLEMDPRTVSKKLTNLEPKEVTPGGRRLYHFPTAVAHLVDPVVDTETFIRKMKIKDLPQALQKEVWDARLKEQLWRSRAGHLWHTEDVLSVLGDTFQTLRTTTQLWSDQIAEKYDLPSEVVEELTSAVDGLRRMLHEALIRAPKEKATRSHLAEVEVDI